MIHPENNLQMTGKYETTLMGKKPKKKKPTGIIKDLMELDRYYMSIDLSKNGPHEDPVEMLKDKIGAYVEWSQIQAIIDKYNNP